MPYQENRKRYTNNGKLGKLTVVVSENVGGGGKKERGVDETFTQALSVTVQTPLLLRAYLAPTVLGKVQRKRD